MTIRILVDSSVWLDILKDARLDPVLTAIEDLVTAEAISLIVPEQIMFEFERNKDRVKDARKTTLVATVKRFREALSQIDSEAERDQALQAVSAIDHKLALTADTGEKAITRIMELMAKAPVIAVTDSAKLKAADRSLTRVAPCHQTKNSIADAIILEAYLEAMAADGNPESQFVFVTTNTNDFSVAGGDKRLPHTDLEPHFADQRSVYSTQITDVIRDMDEDMLDEYTFGDDFYEEPRKLSELLEAEHLLFRQVWYNRHHNLRHRVSTGETKLVDTIDLTRRPIPSVLMTRDTWAKALEAAKRTEDEVGLENLGPWDDFEWGMLNGKLSALRWVLGDEWDMLDT